MRTISNTYWGGSDMVFQCLIDDKRALAFKKAIQNTVKKGDIVADLGTGTGILATFALEAGAKKVYAVEADHSLYETLEMNMHLNGYKGKIILIKGDATKVKIPEKVDVVVCEMIATGLIDESQIPAMNNAIKYSKKNVKIVLSKIKNFADLVYINNSFYGQKLEVIQYEYAWDKRIRSKPMTDRQMYTEIDFNKKNDTNLKVKIPFVIERNGKINGVRITNETVFSDGSTFGTSAAYCMPLVLPIQEISVQKGDAFTLSLSYKMCSGMENLRLSLSKKND
jgi:predicted RNA methylase